MAKKNVRFEWYVLNEERGRAEKPEFDSYPYTGGNIKPYNIFDNVHVYESTVKLCEDFKKKTMTLNEFTEELRKIVMWQEWARCEYEICVCGLFEEEGHKIDCYQQMLPNLKIMAKYVLQTYYPRLDMKSVK